MTEPKKPWSIRGNDFSQPGWHSNPTAGYQLMFEFLRLSPSYELARLHRSHGLTNEQKKLLPKDFDKVLETYDLLGDVQSIMFRSWWLKRGLHAFGNPYSKPKVHQITSLKADKDIDLSEISLDLNQFLSDTRREEGLAGSILISIPLGGRRSDVLKQINKLLKQQDALGPALMPTKKPKIELMGKRLHVNALLSGLRVLIFKAAQPKWENWRLGACAELSKSYSDVLDYKGPKKSATPIEQDDRIIMGKITSRALKRFEFMAENAARGMFPCDAPVECSPYNYLDLQARIKQRKRWEKAEKERLTRLYELQARQLKAAQSPAIA